MAWTSGTILVNKSNGKMLKIVHKYSDGNHGQIFVVVDLLSNESPTPTFVLLERDFDNWHDQDKMIAIVKKNSIFDPDPQIRWESI